MSSRFRSIQAFKEFEAKSMSFDVSGEDTSPETNKVSSLRVMDVVKKSATGMRRQDIALALDVGLAAVDDVVLRLLRDDFVKILRGATPEDDLIVA